MKYFYKRNNQQAGPYTLEELKTQYIMVNTWVRPENSAEWVPANEVSALSVLFSDQQFVNPVASDKRKMYGFLDPRRKLTPKQWREGMRLFLIAFGIIIIVRAVFSYYLHL